MRPALQNPSQQVKGRRGPGTDKAWAHRLAGVFAADDPAGGLQAVWKVKEQLRAMLRTNSLADAAAANEELRALVMDAGRPEKQQALPHHLQVVEGNRGPHRHRRHRRKVEPNTGINHVERTARATGTRQLQNGYSHEECRSDGGMTLIRESISPPTMKSRQTHQNSTLLPYADTSAPGSDSSAKPTVPRETPTIPPISGFECLPHQNRWRISAPIRGPYFRLALAPGAIGRLWS